METNIIPTFECELANAAEHSPQMIGKPPLSLRAIAPNTLTQRTITEWSSNLGTYGMGGPGFFGIKLAGDAFQQDSWLILTIWSAGEWLLLDQHWLQASPKYDQVQTLHSDTLGLQHLEIPQDTTKLPPYGNGQQRYWNTQESQKDAWVVTNKTLWVNNDDE
jgi:hypothetical protein